jgi:phospholipid/cholesterol/gamma-HCH transport system substrate-binding protein
MNKRTIDLWVGIFVAIGMAALFFLALKVGNLLNFKEQKNGYEVMMRFDNIGNLKARAPVKSAGVVVGRVERIRLDPKTFEAEVRIHLENNFQFPKDTIAAIFTSGLLGEQFVGLEAGGDSAMLKDEEWIKKTQSAIQIEKLISQFLFNQAQGGNGANGASDNANNAGNTAPKAGVKP